MRTEDIPAVTELARQLGYPSSTREIEARFERLRREPGNIILVARKQGEAQAWIHLRIELSLGSDPRVDVAGLVVDERARNQGIGALLMTHAESWAKEQGIATVRLRSNAIRKDAHRFYERLGYRVQKTSVSLIKDLQE